MQKQQVDQLNEPQERESLLKVRRTKKELHDLMNNLSSKLTEVSSNVDKEFLSSYRVHMLSVQNEIKNLKTDVLKGEQNLNRDVEVAKLETEVKWFADECTRLISHQTAMETDIQQLETRVKELSEQKVYLAEQLKSIMKRNRVLKAEIEYASQFAKLGASGQEYGLGDNNNSSSSGSVYNGSSSSGSSSSSSSRDDYQQRSHINTNSSFNNSSSHGKKKGNTQSLSKLPQHRSPKKNKSNLQLSASAGRLQGNSTLNRGGGVGLSTYGVLSPIDQGGQGRMPGNGLLECSFAGSLVEHQSERQQREVKELVAMKTSMEAALETTIIDVFKELKTRKNETAKRSAVKRFKQKSDNEDEAEPDLDPKSDPYMQKHPIIFTSGGLSGLGLNQFCDSDRFSVIVKFLMNKAVFHEVLARLSRNNRQKETAQSIPGGGGGGGNGGGDGGEGGEDDGYNDGDSRGGDGEGNEYADDDASFGSDL